MIKKVTTYDSKFQYIFILNLENNLENMSLHINPYQMCYRSQEEMNQLCLPSGSLNTTIKKVIFHQPL